MEKVRFPGCSWNATDVDTFFTAYALDRRPSSEFTYEAGKTKLINVYADLAGDNLPAFMIPADLEDNPQYHHSGDANLSGRLGKCMRLGGKIDMDNDVSIGCADAVLTYLHRRRAVNSATNDGEDRDMFRISALEMFQSQDTV